MAKLTFAMMISLDGYINDAQGDFEWGQIDEAVHRHANAEAERLGTEIYGTRMYQTMAVWETIEGDGYEGEFARLWRGIDKIVVSRSLKAVTSKRTTLVAAIEPDEMARMKAASGRDIGISGPTLASVYLNAGLVDEVGIYYIPVVVGSGTPMFRDVQHKLKLERIEERAFDNGVVFMRFRVLNQAS